MIFVILAAAAVPIGSLLWIDHRACRRRMYYAAPVIPGDDAVAAYCEQYVVCEDDAQTVCDEVQDDAETCSDDRQNSGTTSDTNGE